MTETGNRTFGASGTWHDPQALGTLRALHRAGTLATEYGRVRALLARMPATDLPAAGQLLARLDAKEVCRHADAPVVTVAVTGHSTVAPLWPPSPPNWPGTGCCWRRKSHRTVPICRT